MDALFVGLLFADRVIEETNHKKGIIGTFTYFHSEKVPVVFPPWFIYAAVSNLSAEEKHSFVVNIAHEETQAVIFSAGGELQVDGPKTVAELPIPVTTGFPKFGTYIVSFVVDGSELVTRKLDLFQRTQAGGQA